MTEVLSSPTHFPPSPPSTSSSSSSSPPPLNDHRAPHHSYINLDNREEEEEEEETFPFLALLVTVFRKYMVSCRTESESMEIGVPTNVRHVAHVTFDRFNGFLGLPVEFEPEVPRRAPSASASVFGVSTESMQCSYDSRGNSVPTILLLMQRRMYDQGGLQAEGIFRINADNSQEDYVRDQLNRGILPDSVEVYCLAGLIKAWFRELPSGVLDPLDPEQVMQCQSEDECAQLVRLLPPAETALLDWAINLMADVVQEEHHNKMNARNVAMVFSPNMTQMADPLTALMYAVQVMNFLRMLIERTLRQREDSMIDSSSTSRIEPSDETGNHSPPKPFLGNESTQEEEDMEYAFVGCKPVLECPECPTKGDFAVETEADSSLTSFGKVISDENGSLVGENSCKVPKQADAPLKADVPAKTQRYKSVQSSNTDTRKGSRKVNVQRMVGGAGAVEKSSGSSIVSRINSRMERVEAWR